MKERKKLGISTVLITVLLIIIALVFVGLLYMFSRGLFGGLSTTASLEVVKFDIIANPDGSGVINIEVKCTGNVKIKNTLEATIYDKTGAVVKSIASNEWDYPVADGIDAGQTATYLAPYTGGVGLVAGDRYSLTIKAEAVNGMKVSVSSSTVAHP
ncbi:MAG: hypothetical protein QW272_05185 [Candidatus Methanomethylicaceae archaeon]